MSPQPQGTAGVRLAAAVLGVLGSFALFAAYIAVPPAGLISGLLAPFPAAFSRFKFGRGTAVTIILGTIALLTSLFGVQTAILYLLQCGMVALIMPELLVRGLGASRSIAWATAAGLGICSMAALAVAVTSGQNPHLLAVKEINDSITHAISLYEKAGIKGEELDLVKQSMAMAAGLIVKIYPALITIALIAISGLNLALLKRSSSRWNFELRIGDFKDFRNAQLLVWLLIVAGFAMLADTPVITVPALNVLAVLAVLYFLQGLAVITAVLARQAFSGILKAALYLMLLFQPYLSALVAIIGIFDLWGDFRTPRNQENL
ncbi:YybS family protein [Geobacter sp. SVR]|uniref:YybS family protein n=1 Tax=Geobacter sp. SVR TaxID=2495594 RepID=UPI00143EF983|nr:YybS family protein [Geobacter sp. SVR]BCS53151.1 membrane protein [Geobacter sp. SVR]GCF84536.1 membrane protein [Geobacter sp. SVR]